MRGRGGGRTRRGRGGSSCDRRCGVFASGDFVWEKSTPACVVVRQLWRGNKTCRLRVSRQLRCPKVSKGRAESSLVRPQAHTPCPGWGPDAPTTARMVGLPPRVGQYFLSKRKKVPKKASGTATTGKSPLLPILTAGLAMSRAMELDSYHLRLERAPNSPFSAVKMGGPFSLRCLSPLCSPAGGAGQTQIAALGMLRCGWAGFAAQKNRIVFFFCDWRYPYANSVAWNALV